VHAQALEREQRGAQVTGPYAVNRGRPFVTAASPMNEPISM
jgi:hypothetical protein